MYGNNNNNIFYLFIVASINLDKRSVYFIPLCSNSFGYILILVNPGIVFISLIYILLSLSKKKSTLAIFLPSTTLNVFFDISLISFSVSLDILAGISSFAVLSTYFVS